MRKIIRLSFLIDNLIQDFKIPVLRRSNRRPDGAQPCKQHSDRALSLMLLGDFETAGFAGSKRRHSVPAPAGRRLRSLARQESFSLASSCDYSEFSESQVRCENYGSPSVKSVIAVGTLTLPDYDRNIENLSKRHAHFQL